jgi:hypothetical protein
MQVAIIVIFLALCISAPWISRKWGPRGEWAWFIISVSFLFSTILILGDV